MDTSPQIGQLISMPDGVALARVIIQNIVVSHVPGASDKLINIQDGAHQVEFRLSRDECAHLARLLLDELSDESCGITAPAEVI